VNGSRTTAGPDIHRKKSPTSYAPPRRLLLLLTAIIARLFDFKATAEDDEAKRKRWRKATGRRDVNFTPRYCVRGMQATEDMNGGVLSHF